MSDILKRKVLPSESPRAAANQSRTAVAAAMSSGSTTTTTSAETPSGSSMTPSVMQELTNKATTLGSSSRWNTPSSSSRSCFSGASSKTTSFLVSLNPARWSRQSSSHHSTTAAAFEKDGAGNALAKSQSNLNLIAVGNREKALQWIREQSITFVSWYTSDGGASVAGGFAGSLHPACSILSRLTGAIQKLDGQQDSLAALKELRGILIRTMLGYMANEVNQQVEHADGLPKFRSMRTTRARSCHR